MLTDEEKVDLKEKIIHDDLEYVFSFLTSKSKGTQYYNGIILLFNRYNRLKRENVLGTIRPEEFNLENNKIVKSLLLSIEDPNNFTLYYSEEVYSSNKRKSFKEFTFLIKFMVYFWFAEAIFSNGESIIQENHAIADTMSVVNIDTSILNNIVYSIIVFYFIYLIARLKK